MNAPRPTASSTLPSSRDQAFPTLTPAQMARVAAHGRVRRVRAGEVLLSAGEQAERLFVVTAGRVEIVRQSGDTEELVAVGEGSIAIAFVHQALKE